MTGEARSSASDLADGALTGPDGELLARLAAEGIRTVRDLLSRCEGIRDLPRRANYRFSGAGIRAFVKREKRSRSDSREVRGHSLLQGAGVPTAPLLLHGSDPALGRVTVTLDLAPARPLDALLVAGLPAGSRRRRLADDLAAAVARLHDARLHHRDLYLNHVYADPDRDPPDFRILDLERVARHRRRLSRWVVKDLAALLVSVPPGRVAPRELLRFALAYLRGRAIEGRARRRRLLSRVERKARRMRSHRPRTPTGEAARRPPLVGPA